MTLQIHRRREGLMVRIIQTPLHNVGNAVLHVSHKHLAISFVYGFVNYCLVWWQLLFFFGASLCEGKKRASFQRIARCVLINPKHIHRKRLTHIDTRSLIRRLGLLPSFPILLLLVLSDQCTKRRNFGVDSMHKTTLSTATQLWKL